MVLRTLVRYASLQQNFLHVAAIAQPASTITNLAIRACNEFTAVFDSISSATCENEHAGIGNTGPYLAQLLAKMSMATGDMQGYCFYNWEVCEQPPTIAINESAYFKPTPTDKTASPTASGPNIFSWNYNLLSSLWEEANWISKAEAQYASTHYGAYATVTKQGLKIISLNTDFWYTGNIFNYINMTNPDISGILTFLANELQKSEDINQRVWIIGHVVPSGYDGTNSLPNPTALFYSIVARFSPTTIAGIFFGHNHEDQLQIFYDYLPNSTITTSDGSILRNTTLVDFAKPLSVSFVGPSITPLANLNAGWTLLRIDSKIFSVINSQTFSANISNSASWTTPVREFEYDSRTTFDPESEWPEKAPLNATFWNGVTEKMLLNGTLVGEYNFLETKKSAKTETCTSACVSLEVGARRLVWLVAQMMGRLRYSSSANHAARVVNN